MTVKTKSTEVTARPKNGPPPPAAKERSLAEQLKDRGVSNAVWHTLANSVFPGARPTSVLLLIDYCKARGLDPLKKPCHIVPMKVKDAQTGNEEWRDVILPGIYELRITAHRTGKYLGHTEPQFGPMIEVMGVHAPEWCAMTFRRATDHGVAEFPARVYFREVVGTARGARGELYVNARWTRSPIQMLCKCTEADGVRRAFPEELGGQMSADEMDDAEAVPHALTASAAPQPPALPDVAELNARLGLTETEEAVPSERQEVEAEFGEPAPKPI